MRFHCVIISKMPRVRVRQGKTGRNGRDTMRFQRVIILLESHILLEIRVTARGVAGSEIVALHAARGVTGSEIVALHAARGVMRSTVIRSVEMNCGPPQACLDNFRRSEKQVSR